MPKYFFVFFKSTEYIVYSESKQTPHYSNMPFQIMTYCQNTPIAKFPLNYIWRWGFILTGLFILRMPYGHTFHRVSTKVSLQMDSSFQK